MQYIKVRLLQTYFVFIPYSFISFWGRRNVGNYKRMIEHPFKLQYYISNNDRAADLLRTLWCRIDNKYSFISYLWAHTSKTIFICGNSIPMTKVPQEKNAVEVRHWHKLQPSKELWLVSFNEMILIVLLVMQYINVNANNITI